MNCEARRHVFDMIINYQGCTARCLEIRAQSRTRDNDGGFEATALVGQASCLSIKK
jgi:hypothetical protein